MPLPSKTELEFSKVFESPGTQHVSLLAVQYGSVHWHVPKSDHEYSARSRGWPSLSMRVPFSMSLHKAGLSLECLGVTSRGLSWVLQLPGAHSLGERTIDGLARRLVLGDEGVWVDWPYASEARVVCVTTANERCWRDRRGGLARCDVHPTEWKELAGGLASGLANCPR